MSQTQKPLASSFAVNKSTGGLTVYWSGEWRDRYGLAPVFVNVATPVGRYAVARFEFRHRNDARDGFDITRSDVVVRAPTFDQNSLREIAAARPLCAARVVLWVDDALALRTKWISNLYV